MSMLIKQYSRTDSRDSCLSFSYMKVCTCDIFLFFTLYLKEIMLTSKQYFFLVSEIKMPCSFIGQKKDVTEGANFVTKMPH